MNRGHNTLASRNDVHVSLRDSFVPLPSEPGAPLTPEQLAAIAGGRNVKLALSDILRIGARLIDEKEVDE